MRGLLNGLQHALRQLKKSLGLTAIVIVTLALAIGANTIIFSIVDAVMLRPLPYAKPQQLVEVERTNRGIVEPSAVSYPEFFDWRLQNHTLEHLVSYHDKTFTLTGVARAVQLDAEVVSWDLLPMLGIGPELGRGFTEQEEKRGTRVALISHSLWESQFASDKSVLGRGISLSETPYTIIGVMPSSFRFPIDQPLKSVWTTLAVDDDPGNGRTPAVASRSLCWLNVIGRLKPGTAVAQADRDLKVIAAQLAKEYPDTNRQQSSALVETYLAAVLGDTRTLLVVALGAVTLVLLIACGNIANLLLVRVRDRQREIALLSALGAGRGRILWQLLAESLTLGVAGGLAGCGLAFLCTPAVLRLIPGSIPRAADAGVDLSVLGFALLVSLVSGLICGIFPAVTALRTDLISTLKEGGSANISRHNWFRSVVIVGQTALGIMLTASAGLLITSFVNLTHRDKGFNPDHLLTFLFQLPNSQYKDKYPQFYQRYFEKLRALPGVQSAGGSRVLPMTAGNLIINFENPERPVLQGRKPRAELTPVSTGYFRSMQVPLLEGRDFTGADDRNSSQVMIVSQAFAQNYFPGEDALALILTVVGLYGLMTYSVSRRTREIGVRLALGAQPSTVLKMVLRDAAILLLTGIGIGLTATIASASLLRTMLYGTGSRNPQVLAAVCIVVALAGLLAAFLPALRAAAVEPMQALRMD